MNKKIVIMSVCMALSFSVFAQKKRAKVAEPATWAESIAQAKNQADAQMQKTLRPVASKVVKSKAAAEPFSADISGLDEMVLYTWSTVTVLPMISQCGQMPGWLLPTVHRVVK